MAKLIDNLYFQPEYFWIKQIHNKKYIFVDFFDTLVYRRVHSKQLLEQWAKALSIRLHTLKREISSDSLISLRIQAERELRKSYDEPPYTEVMSIVYIRLHIDCYISKDVFIEASLDIDIAVELGCQYANKRMLRFLRRCHNMGFHIFVISDFYLPEKTYYDFLFNAGYCGIIDSVFNS